jgi:hypothetical protein
MFLINWYWMPLLRNILLKNSLSFNHHLLLKAFFLLKSHIITNFAS